MTDTYTAKEQHSPIIVIAGPTAVGKTRLGVDVCRQIGGEVVSCDSMQIYRDMNIGTAKATQEEMLGVPHHMMSIVSPSDAYSVAQYQEDAEKVIQEIFQRGNTPVLVGGTGLYINAVLFPMTFLDYDPALREKIAKDYATYGNEAMYERLRLSAPQMAAKLSPNDVKRVSRALELVAMGKEHHRDDLDKKAKYPYRLYVLDLDRKELYDRIDMRVDQMILSGVVEEVKSLLDRGVKPDSQSFQAIAYKEFAAFLHGDMGYEEAVALVKKRSRNYAKRQLTWFRASKDAIWLDAKQDNTQRIVQDWRDMTGK